MLSRTPVMTDNTHEKNLINSKLCVYVRICFSETTFLFTIESQAKRSSRTEVLVPRQGLLLAISGFSEG